MANYAKNLIGDWETEQFEPLRQVAQKTYQTNWDKLTNDFNSLNEQLAQNFKNARIQHNDALLNNARNSYMRMVNAEQNLANRGLTGSGLLNTYDAMNTQQTGQENNAALQTLMDANKANIEGRFSGLDVYNKNLNELSGDLLNNLSGITDAEGDNLRKYANLVADLNESQASRAANSAIENRKAELEEYKDSMYQFLAIKDILADEETDTNTKYYDLIRDAGVTPEQAEKIISSYSYTQTSEKLKDAQNRLQKSKDKTSEYKNADAMNSLALTSLMAAGVINPALALIPAARGIGYGINKMNEGYRTKKVDKLSNELSTYTYEDLKDIMGY